MATQADIRNRALQRVGIADIYNSVDAPLANKADELFVALHEELIDDQVVDWELSAIPVRAENAIAKVLAEQFIQLKPSIDPQTRVEIFNESKQGMSTLYKQASIPYNGEPVQADYF